MARIITITSGKGGVGKTSISVNLAVYLAGIGYRVCLFDADLGLANANILLGLYPDNTLEDVVEGGLALSHILIKDCHGVDIIPGSSGIGKMADMTSHRLRSLVRSFGDLDKYDMIIVDTSAGVSRNVMAFCLASTEIILTVAHDPASLTDAYALVKLLVLNRFDGPIQVLVNQCPNVKTARLLYEKFSDTVSRFLSVSLGYLGGVLHDVNVIESSRRQEPFILGYPVSPASKCIHQVADQLVLGNRERQNQEFDDFLKGFLRFMNAPLKYSKKRAIEIQHGASRTGERGISPSKTVQSLPQGAGHARFYPAATSGMRYLGEYITGVNAVLGKLVEGIDAIADELGAIRQLMKPGPVGDDSMAIKETVPGPRKRVTLDFEAYLENRSSSETREKFGNQQ